MSHGTTARKGIAERSAEVVALGVVFAVMFVASRAVPSTEGAAGLITAMGFLLLSGMLASALLEIVGLPHLTGYLLAGCVAGPNVLHLVDHHAVQSLAPVNTLALSLIALAGGTELRIELLKQVLRSLTFAMLLQSVLGVVVVGLGFLSITRFLPFTVGLGTSALVGIAILWGVLAICRSPSATLGIFSQMRPDGPVSRFSLAFVMSSDVVVAMLLTASIALTRPLIEPSAGLALRDFTELGHEILGSVSLGTTLGLALTAYLWAIGTGGFLVVLIAIGFGITEGLHYLRFDPLLAFMVAGFVVANFSQQGEKLLSSVDRTGNVVYVVFFATAGAHLDLPLVRELWPIALFLGGIRALTTWGAHRLASYLAKDDPVVKRWGWSSLVSQAGLTIGMAVVVERSYPSFGAGFRSLAIANVALNELVGPILFKFALDRTGESGKGTQEMAFHESVRPPAPA
ncbi:MAG TPA: cation:proton antiporter [Polyangiaceae bacterium]|jgi:Kef-type K+ transport system membrane component KefB|nr:cation:proton antiporter [Polyangiaceae bacterium]